MNREEGREREKAKESKTMLDTEYLGQGSKI